ncbi:HalOD1 output domain-containing protein [Haloprofundus halobius]|uniref:HalOD1 output domain-containing protein n=1 Tax=Haloprofundus halobius TaxID=2876194 RepID=UPI001CCFED47|nr:HalOD1 output domain-containing protein [Haloprofundus halobius]
MDRSPTSGSGASSDLLVDIIETLETCGLGRDEYQLHNSVDVEALEQLVASSDDDIAVQFTVEGIQLDVSPEGVDVVVEDQPDTGSK